MAGATCVLLVASAGVAPAAEMPTGVTTLADASSHKKSDKDLQDDGISAARKVVAEKPDDARAHFDLASALMVAEQYEEASAGN